MARSLTQMEDEENKIEELEKSMRWSLNLGKKCYDVPEREPERSPTLR